MYTHKIYVGESMVDLAYINVLINVWLQYIKFIIVKSVRYIYMYETVLSHICCVPLTH